MFPVKFIIKDCDSADVILRRINYCIIVVTCIELARHLQCPVLTVMYSFPTYISQTAASLALLERIYYSTLKCIRFGLQVVRRCAFIHDTCYIDISVSTHRIFNPTLNWFLADDVPLAIYPTNRVTAPGLPVPYIGNILVRQSYHSNIKFPRHREFQGKLVIRFQWAIIGFLFCVPDIRVAHNAFRIVRPLSHYIKSIITMKGAKYYLSWVITSYCFSDCDS